MSFLTDAVVRFGHVDAAGIVFYPRYFEMLNGAVEDFFADAIGVAFAALHLKLEIGVPTVRLETEFHAPSRLGDQLDIRLTVEQIGTTSCSLKFHVSCAGEMRLTARNVLVCVNLSSGEAVPWPDDIRRALSDQLAVNFQSTNVRSSA